MAFKVIQACVWISPRCLNSCITSIKNHRVQRNVSYKFPGWWFQPIWKVLVKFGSFPQVGVKIKNIWVATNQFQKKSTQQKSGKNGILWLNSSEVFSCGSLTPSMVSVRSSTFKGFLHVQITTFNKSCQSEKKRWQKSIWMCFTLWILKTKSHLVLENKNRKLFANWFLFAFRFFCFCFPFLCVCSMDKKFTYQHMGVSENGGFSPQIIHFNRGFPLFSASNLGETPLFFWKYPHERFKAFSVSLRLQLGHLYSSEGALWPRFFDCGKQHHGGWGDDRWKTRNAEEFVLKKSTSWKTCCRKKYVITVDVFEWEWPMENDC